MSVLEKVIENRVVVWAKKHGFLTPKVKFVENGYPDRLFISPNGHTIFIEFKRPGFAPAPLQHYRINELKKRGVPAFWCDTEYEALNILKTALEPSQLPETSDPTPIESGVRRIISGPRSGENFSRLGSFDGPKGQRSVQESTDRSSSAANGDNVAQRDTEVGRILDSDVCDSSRSQKGGCTSCDD